MNIEQLQIDDIIEITNDTSIFLDRSNFNLKNQKMRILHIDYVIEQIEVVLFEVHDALEESHNIIFLDCDDSTYSSDTSNLNDIEIKLYDSQEYYLNAKFVERS